MCLESQRLDKQIKSLQAQLKTFPEGDFYCTCYRDYYKWYQSIGGKSQYIKKSNHSLAEKLAIKKYLSLQLEEWSNSTFTQCTKYPEHKIHLTASGNMVRSKSEVLIDMQLYINQIPFRYECELQLGDVTIYPDFTVRNPRTSKTYYWEHFGIMDDSSYTNNVSLKLNTYISNHIIPTIDLITTYETQNHPLTIDTINRVIATYLT